MYARVRSRSRFVFVRYYKTEMHLYRFSYNVHSVDYQNCPLYTGLVEKIQQSRNK